MAGNSIANRIIDVKNRIKKAKGRSTYSSNDVRLVGVSKIQPIESVKAAFEEGLRDFGENYVQELVGKMDAFSPEEIRWHFIGPLQRNKAKFIVGKVDLIHSVGSLKLAEMISKIAGEKGITQGILLQVQVVVEDSKAGIPLGEAEEVLIEISKLPNVSLRGLMTLPPWTENSEASRDCFRQMRTSLKEWQSVLGSAGKGFVELSMGTTQDFEVAIEEGATIVRVGTSVFGPRENSRKV